MTAVTMMAAYAGSIDFELGGPCDFNQTTALTTAYSALGVTFGSTAANRGGAVINKRGNFGLNARIGTDFLALSTDANLQDGHIASGPELILFSAPVSNVSLYVGSTSTPKCSRPYAAKRRVLVGCNRSIRAPMLRPYC